MNDAHALPVTQARRGLAIASMVLGIVSIYPMFVIGFIPGVIAIALGLKHRNEARELQQQPSAMGTAGWICGIVGASTSTLFWVIVIIGAVSSA